MGGAGRGRGAGWGASVSTGSLVKFKRAMILFGYGLLGLECLVLFFSFFLIAAVQKIK